MTMLKQWLTALLSLLFLQSPVLFAADYAIVTELGSSAKSIALGGLEGFSSSSQSVFENPAGLYRIKRTSVSIFKTNIMNNDVHYNALSIAKAFKFGALGFGYYSAAVSGVPHTVERLEVVPYYDVDHYFDYKNSLMKFSYQTQVRQDLMLGASYTHYHHHYFDVKGRGQNLDLGLIWMKGDKELSALIRNVIPGMAVEYKKMEHQDETIPTHIVVSSRVPWQFFTLYQQLKKVKSNYLPSLGLEYTPPLFPHLDLFAGYKQSLSYTYTLVKNITVGLGLNLYDVHFYYAYEKSDYITHDNKSYFSMTYSF